MKVGYMIDGSSVPSLVVDPVVVALVEFLVVDGLRD